MRLPASRILRLCLVGFSAYVLSGLFFVGAIPVIVLALIGTTLELSGQPTCPQSETGMPLCYMSLFVGVMMLLVFLYILRRERV